MSESEITYCITNLVSKGKGANFEITNDEEREKTSLLGGENFFKRQFNAADFILSNSLYESFRRI